MPNDPTLKITEDTLLYHAQFICDHVMSFDEIEKLSEPLLIVAPCMRRLIDLAGIVLKQPIKSVTFFFFY